MRKVTKQAVNCLLNGGNLKISNTEVMDFNTYTIMYLFGNKIAECEWNNGKRILIINNAGWFNNTTKERLNGLPKVSIQQKAGNWYLNGELWNGETTRINLD